jgi:hypothetical protein
MNSYCNFWYLRTGSGGAIAIEGGGGGMLVDCTLQHSWAGCAGGAIDLRNNNSAHPFASSLNISATTFHNNSAQEAVGHDVHIYRNGDNKGAVPCPQPGQTCDSSPNTTRCCYDGDYRSLNVLLPTA